MLLEHSVQGWLDLRFPDKKFEVVGLSYFAWDLSPRDLAVEIQMNADRFLQVRVPGDGQASGFPWSSQYGRGYEGTLYRFEGPRQGGRLRIRLLAGVGEVEPLFLVWRFDGAELKRGWNWRIENRVPGSPSRSPGGHASQRRPPTSLRSSLMTTSPPLERAYSTGKKKMDLIMETSGRLPSRRNMSGQCNLPLTAR